RRLDDPLGPPLAAYLREHVDEELGHDETLLGDLEAIGVPRLDVLAQVPSPSVAALVGGQYYWIHHHHPVSFLGYVAPMEGYTAPPNGRRTSEAGGAGAREPWLRRNAPPAQAGADSGRPLRARP